MQTPVDSAAEYGLGLETDNYFAVQSYGHNGSTPFSKSDYRRFPSEKYTVIFLANTSNFVSRELSKNIFSTISSREIIHPKYKLEIFLSKLLDDKGAIYLKNNFESLIKSNGYDIKEDNRLNNYGYDLLNAGRVDDAIVIFEANTTLFPDIANTFDSLAEAYLQKGEKEKSDYYYKKALEINPNYNK
jgi:tetratricopeptide (TPR) repeat protein